MRATTTTDTSRAARKELEPTVATRESEVLDALQRFRGHHASDPTAYELLRWMQIQNPTLDHNAVRPRLTELAHAGRVQKAHKRQCAITEKRVYTWRVVSPSPVPKPFTAQRPVDQAVQNGLF